MKPTFPNAQEAGTDTLFPVGSREADMQVLNVAKSGAK